MPSDRGPYSTTARLLDGQRFADSMRVPGRIGDGEDPEPDVVAIIEVFERIVTELRLLKTENR